MSEPAQGVVVPTSSLPQVSSPISDDNLPSQLSVQNMPVSVSGSDGAPTVVSDSINAGLIPPVSNANDAQQGIQPEVLQTAQSVPQPTQPVPPIQQVSDPLQAVASAVPQYVQRQTDTLNPPQAGGSINSSKEVLQSGIKLERPQIDAALSGQVAEVEPNRELEMPIEVDGFLKKVENNPDQLPQEVVIVNDPTAPPPTKYLAKPVIVLPITPEIEKQAKYKSTAQSVSWLVAWSRKIMKMFTGEVVYRESTN